ncbi:MAG: hypothetical protein ABEK04_04810 [Candidatus Nanohalobium sp.]
MSDSKWHYPRTLKERLWSRIYDKIQHDHKKNYIVPRNFADDPDELKDFVELIEELEDKRLVFDQTKKSWKLLSEDVTEYKEALGVDENLIPDRY